MSIVFIPEPSPEPENHIRHPEDVPGSKLTFRRIKSMIPQIIEGVRVCLRELWKILPAGISVAMGVVAGGGAYLSLNDAHYQREGRRAEGNILEPWRDKIGTCEPIHGPLVDIPAGMVPMLRSPDSYEEPYADIYDEQGNFESIDLLDEEECRMLQRFFQVSQLSLKEGRSFSLKEGRVARLIVEAPLSREQFHLIRKFRSLWEIVIWRPWESGGMMLLNGKELRKFLQNESPSQGGTWEEVFMP